MTQPFEVHIALRYLFARRKQAFISVISLVSTLGVIVGVMALVLALALMTGMQRELRNRILGATAHLFVWKHGGISDYQAEAAKLRTVPGVTGAAPAIIGKALISSGRGEAFITLKGIDPALERSVTDIAGAMKSGTLDALADDPGDGLPGIVIGADLAQTLGVVEGDEVTVLTPQGNLTPMGVYPRSRRARVVGRFSLGLYEFDSAYGLVSLPLARRMLDRTEVDVIELRIDDIYRAARGLRRDPGGAGHGVLQPDLGRAEPRALPGPLAREDGDLDHDRPHRDGGGPEHRGLAGAARDGEEPGHRHPEDDGRVRRAASWPCSCCRAWSSAPSARFIGASMGYAVATVLDRYQLIRVPMDVYQIAYVPFVIEGPDLAVVVAMALVICFVATIYPSRQAARLDPVDALRFG